MGNSTAASEKTSGTVASAVPAETQRALQGLPLACATKAAASAWRPQRRRPGHGGRAVIARAFAFRRLPSRFEQLGEVQSPVEQG